VHDQKIQQHRIKLRIPHKDKSRELQRKLYLAAKRKRNRRFHALYDRIYRPDILWRAWFEVRANGGKGGVDGLSFEDIEKEGVDEFLGAIAGELEERKYRPQPVLRVNIPKPDGSSRPLGIPTIKDRVVQQACKIVVEPIFEANFQENSYGFRPRRGAKDAVLAVEDAMVRNWWVVDADIKGFFDAIDHEILIRFLRRRISDRRVLKLIRFWLKSGVQEEGRYVATNLGSPQGGVISPLLANIYLHVFDMLWNTRYAHLGKLVRYADDAVILCRYQSEAQQAFRELQGIMGRLRLTLHPLKTRLVRLDEEGFDFLGFHFFKSHSKNSGKLVPYFWPSVKAMKGIRRRIHEMTDRRNFRIPMEDVVRDMNPVIRGWRNYFKVGNSTMKFQQLDYYVITRLLRFARKRGGKRGWMKRQDFNRWYHRFSGVERFFKPGIVGT
jgi:RNA-directed DNA polymerase